MHSLVKTKIPLNESEIIAVTNSGELWCKKNKIFYLALVVMCFSMCYTTGTSYAADITLSSDSITYAGKIAVKINLTPCLNGKEYCGPLFVMVHDLSTTPSTRVLITNTTLPGQIEFEINKVAVDAGSSEAGNELAAYRSSSIYIHVTNGKGTVSGGVAVVFDAGQRDTALNVQVNLVETTCPATDEAPLVQVPDLNGVTGTDAEAIDYEYSWLKAGEVHSIAGLTVQWKTVASGSDRTVLYHQSYDRTYTYNIYATPPTLIGDTGWVSCGKLPTRSIIGDYAQATGDNQYDVRVYVKYACEEWVFGPDIGNPYIMEYYYFMYPLTFNDVDLGSSFSCATCDTNHPIYAGTWNRGTSSNPFTIGFTTDIADNTQWKVDSVSFEFSLLYKTVSFGAGIALYRAAGETGGAPPTLSVNVNTGDTLYYWHDGDDTTQYKAHFSRS